GAGASWIGDTRKHPKEALTLALDTSKARVGLDWYPHLPLAQSLTWIVEWYKGFQAGADLASLTRSQTDRYESILHSNAELNTTVLRTRAPHLKLHTTVNS